MSKQFILYVGPHRSGSTFLQGYIFPHIPDVYCVYSRDQDCNVKVMNAFDEHPLFRDVDAIKKDIHARFEGVEEPNVLISDEEYFGDYGHYNSGGSFIIKPFHNHQQRADLLAQLFPGAKVILTFRRQDLWIESAYMHFIHNYFTISVDEFLDRTPHFKKTLYRWRSRKPGCDFRMLNWIKYLENYQRLFGKKNVLVVPHEMVLNDLRPALDRLYAFLGVPPYYPETVPHPGRSLSRTSYRLALILNRFVNNVRNRWGIIPAKPFAWWLREKRREKDTRLLWFLAGISRRIDLYWFLSEVVDRFGYRKNDVLGPERRRVILDYFKDINKEYARMIGLDLGKYGYY